MQPGMCTLYNPTDFPKATVVRVATPGDAGRDAARVKHASVFVVVGTVVSVDAARTAQRSSAPANDRHNSFYQRNELGYVVTVCASQNGRDRRSVGVGGEMMFGTGSRSIGGVRASFSPAPTARIEDESTITRDKSILSAARSFAKSIACKRSNTPACCQSRSLRQQLTPEPHPSPRANLASGYRS